MSEDVIKTFLINLDKDSDRLNAADAQLKRLGIAYERVSAINGRELNPRQLSKYVSRLRTLMTHGMMWSPGQIGCTLSHLFLYRRMIEENINVAMIIEDDVKFSVDFPKAMRRVNEFVDVSRRQVILFSDHRDNVRQRIADAAENIEIVPILGDICSEAYVITLPAAKEIFRINFPMAVMVDAWTRYRKRGHLELFRVEPPLAKQNRADFKSNIEMPQMAGSFIKRYAWKTWRGIGHVIDAAYYYCTGR